MQTRSSAALGGSGLSRFGGNQIAGVTFNQRFGNTNNRANIQQNLDRSEKIAFALQRFVGVRQHPENADEGNDFAEALDVPEVIIEVIAILLHCELRPFPACQSVVK